MIEAVGFIILVIIGLNATFITYFIVSHGGEEFGNVFTGFSWKAKVLAIGLIVGTVAYWTWIIGLINGT